MFEIFIALLFVMVITLLIALICVPIMIANARGITGGDKTIIVVLSWLGIFFGVTWIVALVLSLVWGHAPISEDNLDKLSKLSKLYKEKVITKEEFEKQKSKYLS